MKFVECHTRIKQINNENLIIPHQNNENHEIRRIPLQNHENHENVINQRQKRENHNLFRIQSQN